MFVYVIVMKLSQSQLKILSRIYMYVYRFILVQKYKIKYFERKAYNF